MRTVKLLERRRMKTIHIMRRRIDAREEEGEERKGSKEKQQKKKKTKKQKKNQVDPFQQIMFSSK